MRSARNDDGFVLIAAIILLTVMMGLGLGLLLLTDSQQKASGSEQASESAFNVAEAALNAQIGQLSGAWPSETGQALPERCTAANASESGCPTAESLKVGYSGATSSTTCPAGTPKDAWGSPLTNEWTTYVRNDVGESPLFNSATEGAASTPHWAESGKVWVRSVGVVQCRMVVLVALISPQIVTVPFPQTAIAGNWFKTSNNGNKIIINTQGKASQSGGVGMRCSGRTAKTCEEFEPGQVVPDTKVTPGPEHTMSASQLETVKNMAKANNTYFPSGKCPGSLAEASGSPVYVEGPCELSYTGNGIGNPEKPGFLVLINGTFKLNGGTEFFGTVYAANAQNSSGIVVELHGHSKLIGSIIVDGNGGLDFGSSGNGNGHSEEEIENFVYNSTAALGLKGFAGASATRNSFRELPVNQ